VASQAATQHAARPDGVRRGFALTHGALVGLGIDLFEMEGSGFMG